MSANQIVVDTRAASDDHLKYGGQIIVGGVVIDISGVWSNEDFEDLVIAELARQFVVDDQDALPELSDVVYAGICFGARYLVEKGPFFRVTRLTNDRLPHQGGHVLVVDLSAVHEARGSAVSYYAGNVVVGFESTDVDGKTDNDGGWEQAVVDGIVSHFPLLGEDEIGMLVHLCMDVGGTYHFGCCPDPTVSPVDPEEVPSIWRAHAEKIAEDVADGILDISADRDEILKFVVEAISRTLTLREERNE